MDEPNRKLIPVNSEMLLQAVKAYATLGKRAPFIVGSSNPDFLKQPGVVEAILDAAAAIDYIGTSHGGPHVKVGFTHAGTLDDALVPRERFNTWIEHNARSPEQADLLKEIYRSAVPEQARGHVSATQSIDFLVNTQVEQFRNPNRTDF